jgi:tryptophanyl-tRNA synthetase
MRPTGRLHLGHYHGALINWIDLQRENDCFYFVADWHALTTEYDRSEFVSSNVEDMVIDWLASGIDPEKSTIFVQSHVKENAELFVLFSMITPLGWLERVPTYKEQIRELAHKDISTYGFLGYPLLQTSDIAMYKANKVPVGIDQVPHIEFSREVIRRFNSLYSCEIFPEPFPILTPQSRLLGIDNRKMSKSYGNAIYLGDSKVDVDDKVSKMITDPKRQRRQDPGDPFVCNVFTYHTMYSPKEVIEWSKNGCQTAKIGCVDCKQEMAKYLNFFLEPLRDRLAGFMKKKNIVGDILDQGTKRASEIAKRTMEEVRTALKIY